MNKMLKNLSKVLSVFVGLTIINVWLFRSNRSTSYRGGDATNLIEEFAVYGLEDYFLIIGIISSILREHKDSILLSLISLIILFAI